jgi:cell division protein FtsN
MPRDYVKARSSRTAERSGPSGFVWMLMGVLIGLIIAGVFYLKNQTRSKSIELPVPQQPKAILPTQSKPSPKMPPSTQNLQTQFDFYNVLPGQKVTGPSGDEDTTEINNQNQVETEVQAQTAKPQLPPPAPTLETPASQPDVASKPTAGTTSAPSEAKPNKSVLPPPAPQSSTSPKPTSYIVQIATLSNSQDVDQLKAQLSLLGFEVRVSKIQKNGKTLERVWMGPYHSQSEAQAIQKQLQENTISGKVLKSNT